MHTHAIRGIFQVPTADNYVRQGVTTIMEGPDGSSPIPLKPFLDKLAALPKSLNIGSFIGQGSEREAVIGLANRAATADELDRMRAIVRDGMRDGAFGLSTEIFYVPGNLRRSTRWSNCRRSSRRCWASTRHTCEMKHRACSTV